MSTRPGFARRADRGQTGDATGSGALARCGWTGKLPSSGDFISRRVAAEFRAPWERWLEGVILASRRRLAERWQERFVCSPAWRFVLSPGVLSQAGWTGVMVPSVDRVGRHYPLTLVGTLGEAALDAEQALQTLRGWLDAAERLATAAPAAATDADAFDEAVAALAPPPAAPAAGNQPAIARSAWQSARSEIAPGWRFTLQGMPDPERYCEMLAGRPETEASAT